MPDDEFKDLFNDDPEFFEHPRPGSPSGDFYQTPKPLPDHYNEEYEPRETEGINERPGHELEPTGANERPEAEFSIPEGPTDVPRSELPEQPADHYIPNEDFGDPEEPETHTIEPPEREQVNAAAQYGPLDEPVTPERPDWHLPEPDQYSRETSYEMPDFDQVEGHPGVQMEQAQAPEAPMPDLEPSENLFTSPAQPSGQTTYNAPWM